MSSNLLPPRFLFSYSFSSHSSSLPHFFSKNFYKIFPALFSSLLQREEKRAVKTGGTERPKEIKRMGQKEEGDGNKKIVSDIE